MRAALVRVGEISLLGVLRVIALAIGLSKFSSQAHLALVHHEPYRRAELAVYAVTQNS